MKKLFFLLLSLSAFGQPSTPLTPSGSGNYSTNSNGNAVFASNVVSTAGQFIGNGAGLTNIPVSGIADGQVVTNNDSRALSFQNTSGISLWRINLGDGTVTSGRVYDSGSTLGMDFQKRLLYNAAGSARFDWSGSRPLFGSGLDVTSGLYVSTGSNYFGAQIVAPGVTISTLTNILSEITTDGIGQRTRYIPTPSYVNNQYQGAWSELFLVASNTLSHDPQPDFIAQRGYNLETIPNTNLPVFAETWESHWGIIGTGDAGQVEQYWQYTAPSNRQVLLNGSSGALRFYTWNLHDVDAIENDISADVVRLHGVGTNGGNYNVFTLTTSRTASNACDMVMRGNVSLVTNVLNGTITLSLMASNGGGFIIRDLFTNLLAKLQVASAAIELAGNGANNATNTLNLSSWYLINLNNTVNCDSNLTVNGVVTAASGKAQSSFLSGLTVNGNSNTFSSLIRAEAGLTLKQAQKLIFGAGASDNVSYQYLNGDSSGNDILAGSYRSFQFKTDTSSSGSGTVRLQINNTAPAHGPASTIIVTNADLLVAGGGNHGMGSTATNQTVTATATGLTNTLNMTYIAYLTAATSLSLTNAGGAAEFSGVTVAAFTPIRVQPGGKLVGSAITYATGNGGNAE